MQDLQEDAYNGKVLVAAIICLSVVVLFVVLLHAYGRWLLRHSRAAAAANEIHEFQRRRLSTGQQAEEGAVVAERDDGLDAKVVAALPEFVYRGREQQGWSVDCVVCLSAMEEGERGKMLPSCGHRFHVSCIDEWLMAHSTCPICRAVAAATGEEVEAVVVVVEEGEVVGGDVVAGGVGEVMEMPVGSGNDDGCRINVKEDAAAASSSTPASCSSSLISCSLKRMMSRSRSDKRVFPSVLGN